MGSSGGLGALLVGIQSTVAADGSRSVKAGQVKTLVASGIATNGLGVGCAGVVVALRGSVHGVREGLGGFDYGGH